MRTIDTGTATVVEIAVARTPHSYTYAQPFTPIFYHGTWRSSRWTPAIPGSSTP